MAEETNNPLEELRQVNEAIRKFELVLKTTRDPRQKERVKKELVRLRNYREKFEHVYSLVEEKEENESWHPFDGFDFLKQNVSLQESYAIHDQEINAIIAIMQFFEKEFLAFLTERRLKLDFKYSLERDGFYHLYQDLMKRIQDFEDEIKIIEEANYSDNTLTEIKNRRLRKRRVLIIETDKLFRRCKHFTEDILKDLEMKGVACLNPDDQLNFDEIEGSRFLEGMTVKEALLALDSFAGEVIGFLNLPEIIQEKE